MFRNEIDNSYADEELKQNIDEVLQSESKTDQRMSRLVKHKKRPLNQGAGITNQSVAYFSSKEEQFNL